MEDISGFKEKLLNLESRILRLEQMVDMGEQPGFKEKKLSLREFVLSKSPSSSVQVTLLIAYYLEKYEGRESFTIKDIQAGFRTAKEPAPTNMSDMIQKNAKKAFIDEVKTNEGKGKAWMLTNSGISEVER